MLHGRFTPRVGRWAPALLINFTISVILPIPGSFCSASNTGQVRQPQQLSESKPKCEPLGFTVYEKWEKPAGLFPFYEEFVVPPEYDHIQHFTEQIIVPAHACSEGVASVK
jgi:hypothetical protein